MDVGTHSRTMFTPCSSMYSPILLAICWSNPLDKEILFCLDLHLILRQSTCKGKVSLPNSYLRKMLLTMTVVSSPIPARKPAHSRAM